MLGLYIWIRTRLGAAPNLVAERMRRGSLRREEGQTTAEYALVILAAAAVALVLIAWARSSGKLPAFFDSIIDEITGDIG
jgi:Flp pilus assembly pilin Flp